MSWFRLDDGWLMHPKMRAAGKDGRSLFVAAGTYCAQQLTDGWIDKDTMPIVAAQADVPIRHAKKLVEVGVFELHGDRYLIHDFLDFNPSRETVIKERERWAKSKRKARHKDSDGESTVDTPEDSRDESTPSRPDPTRSSSCASPPPTTTRATGAARTVVEVTKAITAARLERQHDREIIENDDAYRAGIERNVRAELGERIITTVNDNPDAPTDQLVTLVLGDYEGAA